MSSDLSVAIALIEHTWAIGLLEMAEYFAVHCPDTGKVYMVTVNEATKYNKSLWFKKVRVIRSNGRQSWRVSYEEVVNSSTNYRKVEDYEI